MRKIHFILIFLFAFVFQTNAQDVNKTDAQGRKQGSWQKFHPNGKLRYKGQFKDDKPIGTFQYYSDEGELIMIMKHDKEISRAELYYPNGDIQWQSLE